MKKMKTKWALVLSIFSMAGTVNAETSIQDAAESDQLRISAFVNQHYAGYVENYLKVFSGHFRCDYDFIDDVRFNDLADEALRSLSASVRTLLSHRLQTTLPPMSAEQLDYTSTLVALSVIDAYTERYTAEIDQQYEAGTLDCAGASEGNQVLYNNLPASLAALSGLVIPAD